MVNFIEVLVPLRSRQEIFCILESGLHARCISVKYSLFNQSVHYLTCAMMLVSVRLLQDVIAKKNSGASWARRCLNGPTPDGILFLFNPDGDSNLI